MEEFALEINRTLSPKSQFNPNTPLRYLKKKKKKKKKKGVRRSF